MPEVWIPGSNIPFRPVNPWGAAMPKPVRGVRPALYQLVVTRKGRGEMRMGPQMEKQFIEELYDAVMQQIRSGAEKELTEPHIVLCV